MRMGLRHVVITAVARDDLADGGANLGKVPALGIDEKDYSQSALLGHLNTVVRLIAGAVERAGVYTKTGAPQMSNRIGVMEAVG